MPEGFQAFSCKVLFETDCFARAYALADISITLGVSFLHLFTLTATTYRGLPPSTLLLAPWGFLPARVPQARSCE